MSRPDPVENLLRAFAARDLDAIRALADAGVELDAAGGGGLTTLMRAVLRGDGVAVEWILAAGADPDVRTADGKTALGFAREQENDALVELLIIAGASVREPAEVDPPAPLNLATPPAPKAATRQRAPSNAFSDRFADRFDDQYNDKITAPTGRHAGRPLHGDLA